MERTRRWSAVAMALVASFATVTGVAAQQGPVPAAVTLFPPSDMASTGSCADGIPDDPYRLKFVRKSRDLPFAVMCSIHWNMKTRVTVR